MMEQFLKTGSSVANFVLCLHHNRTGYVGGRKAIKVVMQVICPLTLEESSRGGGQNDRCFSHG